MSAGTAPGLDPGASETVNDHIRGACASGAGLLLLPDTLEEALELGDHTDHMAKEIEEQPAVVAEILDRIAGRAVDGSMWRGLGLALLRESFRRFRETGETVVALGVDADNPTGATRLYERAGMRVLWQADVWEKELRAASFGAERGSATIVE